MATIEQVEKLMEKANVTYEEAREALDAAEGDMLDAIIHLERQGKVKTPENNGKYTTSPKVEICLEKKEKNQDKGESFSSLLGKFFKWLGGIIAKGNVHTFEIQRNGDVMMSIPLTVLAVLLFLAFWVVVPLIIIGLFFKCRYFFRGPDLDKTKVNKVMDIAADAAEDFKKDVKES